MHIQSKLTPELLVPAVDRFFDMAAPKVMGLHESWSVDRGAPVYTVDGRYTTRSWTDWTRGFFVGMALLIYDATGDKRFLNLGRDATVAQMGPHVSHVGVHDHGFNIVSTYGNWRRLMLENRIPVDQHEWNLCELALKASGAVQAARYTPTDSGKGYIYSFNGPQSLFADTIRSLRSLVLAHRLGHVLMGEGDERINLLWRALEHAEVTACYNVYLGEGRDIYDVPGRVAHESIFNTKDGQYRCPSSQQGYSPFSTWTRGAAWIVLGYAEQLEFLGSLADEELEAFGGRDAIQALYLRVLRVTSAYYIDEYSCADGIPFWDTGAPGLVELGDYRQLVSDPFNDYEPVDASAAAIAAQGFIRFGRWLDSRGEVNGGVRYVNAGLTIADTLLSEPYLALDPGHQGLLQNVVYHRPRGWDRVPPGRSVPSGESAMWGDYHMMELALLIKRLAEGRYWTFYGPEPMSQE